MASSKKPIHDPHYQAQHNAQDDAGGNGEEECRVFAAVIDISRQPSERYAGTIGQKNAQADHDQQSSYADQKLAERTHASILSRSRVKEFRTPAS